MEIDMYNIGVIGDYDSIFSFSAVGFDIFPAENLNSAYDIFYKLEKENYGIIYVTEQYLSEMSDIIKAYEDNPTIAIVAVPTVGQKPEFGQSLIRAYAQKAVGTDII